MDEYIDIVDEHGNPTGKSELKSVIHKKRKKFQKKINL